MDIWTDQHPSKRRRSIALSSDDDDNGDEDDQNLTRDINSGHPPESDAPVPKIARSSNPDHPSPTRLICSLPPSCSVHPTYLDNSSELEKHYALYHAHVCQVDKCRCVFPEPRLLELHIIECHDPLVQVRKERGERTFACFVPPPTCDRFFRTPKARRLHLIQAHGYPKEYFFAVANKGIGGLLKKWGDGASLIRGEWKPRNSTMDADRASDENRPQGSNVGPVSKDARSGSGPMTNVDTTGAAARTENLEVEEMTIDITIESNRATASTDMAGLTDRLNTLSLVPDQIRFGRGGKRQGFATRMGNGPRATGLDDKGPELTAQREYDTSANSLRHGGNASQPTRGKRGTGHHRDPVGGGADAGASQFVSVRSRGRGRGKLWVPN